MDAILVDEQDETDHPEKPPHREGILVNGEISQSTKKPHKPKNMLKFDTPATMCPVDSSSDDDEDFDCPDE